MSDLEHRIREALHDPRRELPAWPDPMPRIRKAARRRRARLALGALLAAALVAAAIVAPVLVLRSSTGGGPTAGTATSPPAATASSSPPPAGWVRQSASGVSIDIPATWRFNRSPVSVQPTYLFAAGTGPVPSGGSCGPTAALRALPAKGALFALIEYGSVDEPYTFPPRPHRLDLGPLGGPAECWGVKDHLVLFEDGGRYFQFQAVLGPRAPASLRAEVRRSLDTLHVVPLPASQQPEAQCRAGQWTACPQAAWVYEVISRAGVFHLGHQGNRAILGLAGKRSFALQTTSRRPQSLNQCRKIVDVRVCRSGVRLAWPAQGLWLLVYPASSPFSSPGTTAGLPNSNIQAQLVKASQRIRMVGL
jgi:hypothetical protein